jgi:hypothetical protein
MEEKTVLLTVQDMAIALKISSVAVNKRLQRANRKPLKYIGSAGVYTEADLRAIKEGGARGRPKAEVKDKTAPKTKPKKPTKKTTIKTP